MEKLHSPLVQNPEMSEEEIAKKTNTLADRDCPCAKEKPKVKEIEREFQLRTPGNDPRYYAYNYT